MVVEGFIVIWLHWDSRGGLAGKCRRGASGHIVLASMYGQRASNASGQDARSQKSFVYWHMFTYVFWSLKRGTESGPHFWKQTVGTPSGCPPFASQIEVRFWFLISKPLS